MAINVVSVQYNGGLLPDIILLTQCYLHRGMNSFKCHKRSSVFTAFDPTLTFLCPESLRAFDMYYL